MSGLRLASWFVTLFDVLIYYRMGNYRYYNMVGFRKFRLPIRRYFHRTSLVLLALLLEPVWIFQVIASCSWFPTGRIFLYGWETNSWRRGIVVEKRVKCAQIEVYGTMFLFSSDGYRASENFGFSISTRSRFGFRQIILRLVGSG